jgi:transglutaminase superfamily protein
VRIRGAPASVVVEALLLYAGRRVRTPDHYFRLLLAEQAGRLEPTAEERRAALVAQGVLRRIGVRCLRRSAVATEMLRRRGVAARIRLSVATRRPADAHAEVEVNGTPLRPHDPARVVLR